jgi:hypothetical protein
MFRSIAITQLRCPWTTGDFGPPLVGRTEVRAAGAFPLTFVQPGGAAADLQRQYVGRRPLPL